MGEGPKGHRDGQNLFWISRFLLVDVKAELGPFSPLILEGGEKDCIYTSPPSDFPFLMEDLLLSSRKGDLDSKL